MSNEKSYVEERRAKPYETGHRLRLDYTINLGVLIHLAGLVLALMTIMVTLSAWKAATDERLKVVEDELSSTKQMVSQTQETLFLLNERLSRIEGKIDQQVK